MCDLRVVSYGFKTVLKSLHVLMRICTHLGFSRNDCVGVARIVTLHLDNEKFVHRFLYQLSQLEGRLVQQ